jgi:hypothetical protein
MCSVRPLGKLICSEGSLSRKEIARTERSRRSHFAQPDSEPLVERATSPIDPLYTETDSTLDGAPAGIANPLPISDSAPRMEH